MSSYPDETVLRLQVERNEKQIAFLTELLKKARNAIYPFALFAPHLEGDPHEPIVTRRFTMHGQMIEATLEARHFDAAKECLDQIESALE